MLEELPDTRVSVLHKICTDYTVIIKIGSTVAMYVSYLAFKSPCISLYIVSQLSSHFLSISCPAHSITIQLNQWSIQSGETSLLGIETVGKHIKQL